MITTSILPVNTPPVGYNTLVTVPKALNATFVPRASDADGNLLRYKFTTLPANGAISVYDSVAQASSAAIINQYYNLSTTTATYTPTGLFVGQDIFQFTPNDFTADGNSANITVNVAARDRTFLSYYAMSAAGRLNMQLHSASGGA